VLVEAGRDQSGAGQQVGQFVQPGDDLVHAL
jgi:hypothetical protein